MALIKLGSVVAGIRGALGGVVYARNRGGNFARNNTYPVDPSTAAQVTARARLASLQTEWQQELTTAQRTTWNDLADATTFVNALGEEYKPTGLNLYIRTNVQQLIAEQSINTTAPAVASVALPALTLSHTTGTGIEITAYSGGTVGVAQGNVYLSTPKFETVNFFKGPFTFNSTHATAGLASLPMLIVPNADLIEDRRYFVRIIAVEATGAVSNASVYPVDVGTIS